jgi:hypothetical protein
MTVPEPVWPGGSTLPPAGGKVDSDGRRNKSPDHPCHPWVPADPSDPADQWHRWHPADQPDQPDQPDRQRHPYGVTVVPVNTIGAIDTVDAVLTSRTLLTLSTGGTVNAIDAIGTVPTSTPNTSASAPAVAPTARRWASRTRSWSPSGTCSKPARPTSTRGDFYARRDHARTTRRLVAPLERLGHSVTLTEGAAA